MVRFSRDPRGNEGDEPVDYKGQDDVELEKYHPLYQAALRDDWESGKIFLDKNPKGLTEPISMRSMTALHVAAASGCWDFVEKLVAEMPEKALELRDETGRTALHYVAIGGSTKAAKAMVNKNSVLTQLTSRSGRTPLYYATNWGITEKDIVWYLCYETKAIGGPDCPFTGDLAANLITKITDAGYYDIALYLIKRFPNLAEETEIPTLLKVMAEEPLAFKISSHLGTWEGFVYSFINVESHNKPPHSILGDMKDPLDNSMDIEKGLTSSQSRTYSTQVTQFLNRIFQTAIKPPVLWIKHIRDMKLKHKYALELLKCLLEKAIKGETLNLSAYVLVLETATKYGILELVMTCLHYIPDLIWEEGKTSSLFHAAVKYREEKIYNLLNERNARNVVMTLQPVDGRISILHLAAELAPYAKLNYVSGAALQMQRELQWFSEIEKSVSRSLQLAENIHNQTAFEVFTETHKDLRENGEKWMKDTSNSCMVVSTLIATVVFAAAFTVPGGNKSDNGIPVFLRSNSFLIFAISDALALFSSITSVLIFLSILTSRFAVRDFEEWLPKRLILGLSSLLIAIATMMISFVAALTIILNRRLRWVAVPISTFACVPVGLFALLQLPMFIQIVRTTYGPGIFRPKHDHWIKPKELKILCHIED